MPVPDRPVLTTSRLRLFPQTLTAARALLNGIDPGFPLGAGYPHADTVDAIRMLLDASPSPLVENEDGFFFASLIETGEVIGDCGTKGWVDEQGRVEIGYGLAAPWRGRGLGAEAVRALVEWLREQPDVRTITAEVEIGNLPSRRLLERIGFMVTGTRGAHWELALFVRPVPPTPPAP